MCVYWGLGIRGEQQDVWVQTGACRRPRRVSSRYRWHFPNNSSASPSIAIKRVNYFMYLWHYRWAAYKVSGYGLDDRDSILGRGERIFALTSVSRPALGTTQPPVQWVPGVLSPGVKRDRGVTLTTHPHLVPRSGMSRSYTFSPRKRHHGV
jgi:hypothetical protein